MTTGPGGTPRLGPASARVSGRCGVVPVGCDMRMRSVRFAPAMFRGERVLGFLGWRPRGRASRAAVSRGDHPMGLPLYKPDYRCAPL